MHASSPPKIYIANSEDRPAGTQVFQCRVLTTADY